MTRARVALRTWPARQIGCAMAMAAVSGPSKWRFVTVKWKGSAAHIRLNPMAFVAKGFAYLRTAEMQL